MPVKKGHKAARSGEDEKLPLQSRVWLEGFEMSPGEKPDGNYTSYKISLPADLIDQLKKFSRQKKIPLSTIMHGAWGLLLNRYSTSDDIIYGAGCFRPAGKMDTLAISTLPVPVRSTLHDEESIEDYLKALDANLQKPSKKTRPRSSEIKNDSVFSYLLLFPEKRKKTAKKTEQACTQADPEKYPLVLVIRKENTAELFSSNSRYTTGSAERLATHFIIILETIASEPGLAVTHFSILDSDEKHKLLHDWNRLQHNRPHAGKQDASICDLFARTVKELPGRTVIAHNNTVMSYKELDEISSQIAHYLLQKKVRPGDPVAVLMERTPALIATMLGIFKAGAMYVPVNPKYPDERIQFILEDCNTHIILVNNTQRIPKDFLYKTSIINDSYAEIKNLPAHVPVISELPADQIAYVIYTSGTTGQPKGVMIRQSSLVNHVSWYKHYFHVTPEDRASQFASQGFDTFFCETIPFLSLGASIYIIDDHEKLTPSVFLPWLAINKITICDLPTAYAQILFNMPWPETPLLRLVKVGGESLTHFPAQKFSFDIWNGYGPTEATIESTFIKFYRANTDPKHQPATHPSTAIGKPVTGTEVYVVDNHMELAPIGVVGELLIGGASISPGYLNRPQLTREKFIRNVFSNNPDEKLYRTGDMVRWLHDGNLEFIGRVDHQVKIRGYRIELSEIETAIAKFDDVSEVVVLAKELINGQKSLVAYLVPNLEKIRIPYQERCLIALNDIRYLQALSEDISREGMAISGLTEKFDTGQSVQINFKLPGSSDSQWLTGKVIWQIDQRAGILFDQTEKQKLLLQKSIEYYLSTHNLMETIQSAAAKRSLRKALREKLPEYMIPAVFTILPQFPLTFNGKIDWKALPPPQDFDRLLERNFVEPRNETEKKVADIWCDILNVKKVSITDNFFDLGGNSLLVSQLSVKILLMFNISIPTKIFLDLPFIPVIAEYIDSRGQQYTHQSSIQEEIARDAILHDDLVPGKTLSTHLHDPEHILLTGASGFLGVYLLRELLTQTKAKIYCLIRKGNFESVARRLVSNLEQYQLSDEISLADRRIVLIQSDIALDQFGIPAEQYNNLAGKIDLIYHCGAQVNTMASYTHLRSSNVQGTIEIIRFALKKMDKPIHYISTLSAAQKLDAKGNFAEDFPDADASHLVGGYAISKWVSERLLTQIKNRKLPVCIYRSGYIFGQSDTGITNMNDALLLLIKGCIQLGFAPDWKEKTCILPVDFVSRAIVGISLHHPEKSGVFHLDHPVGIMWTDLIAWLNDYGYSIRLCSHKAWLQHLMKITPESALYPFLPHYLSQTEEPHTPGTAMACTLAALKEIRLPIPDINDHALRIYMKYLCLTGFFPEPGKRKQGVI